MEGKTKSKKKLWKVILLAMSFVLVIVLTASVTLSWFYSSDWANKEVTMGGAVGIEMRDKDGRTTGQGNFHFEITGSKAYPGQAVEVEASVFNNGGISGQKWWANATQNDVDDDRIGFQDPTGEGDSVETSDDAAAEQAALAASGEGSACYVRARFVIFTNIGSELNPDWTEGDDISTKYINDVDYAAYNAQSLYEALILLVTANNNNSSTSTYDWVFWQNNDARMPLQTGETAPTYYDGSVISSAQAIADGGYFYLCYDKANNPTKAKTLYPLAVGSNASFLWDGTFVIPWQLTNASADKTIFIAVEFQAIQTFIPKINASGIINTDLNNQLEADKCTYDDRSVQTVFNSSVFTPLSTLCTNGSVNYHTQGTGLGFKRASLPNNSEALSGTVIENSADHSTTAPAEPEEPGE